MLKNRLLNITILSLFLHLGIFFFISPVFYSGNLKNFLYSWGEFHKIESFLKSKENSFLSQRINFQEFFLPLNRQISTEPTKIIKKSKFSKNLPILRIKQLPQKEKSYFLYPEKQYPLVSLEFLPLIKQASFFKKIFLKDRLRVNLLISPAGRVIWAEGFNPFSNIFLRFDLEDWLKNLVFPAQRIYYWKNIEIVLK